MDLDYAEKYGDALLDYAFDMLWLRETCGVNHAEFIFVRMVKHLRECPDIKSWFLKKVGKTMANDWPELSLRTARPVDYVPEELVEYVAHVMRWAEFKELAVAELVKHKGNQCYLMSRNLPSSVLSALEEDWADVDMYESLRQPRGVDCSN